MDSKHHCNDCPYWYVTKKKYPSGFYDITICRKYGKQIYYLAGDKNRTPYPCSICEKEFSYVPYMKQELLQEVEKMAERLSDKNPCINCKADRQIGNPNRWECECSRCDKPNDWKNECVKKLAVYETAEDEGRLVVLPSTQVYSSLGGYVYYIYDYEIAECVNCAITIDADGRMWICLAADEDIFPYREPIAEFDTDPTDWCQKAIDVLVSEWGKTVFLTHEEAEKALEEMEKDE